MERGLFTTAQIMMTLSAMAYEEDAAAFGALLASPDYATQGEWKLARGPASADLTAYSVFVVERKSPNEHAVVIRGSVLSREHPIQTIIDWLRDIELLNLVPFSDSPEQGKIASGTSTALKKIVSARAANGISLQSFLETVSTSKLYVTGHSLGGCQAGVVTALTRNLRPNLTVAAYTFAAATAGDEAFAKFVGGSDYHRIWNQWDFVAQDFAEKSLQSTLSWYPSPETKMNWLQRDLVEGLTKMLPTPNPYTQPGSEDGLLPDSTAKAGSFLAEVADQHDYNLYLKLLGAPQLPTGKG